MYEIENDLAPTHMKEMFVKTSDLHTYSTRSATSGAFHPLTGNSILVKLFPVGVLSDVWNWLPVEIRKAQSIENFHNSLTKRF